jgi:transcriptional regulator with XRE-family HTH domain
MKTISDQLRAAIESAGVSRYRIGKETGVNEAALSRFMSRKTGLDLSTVDRLAAYLGLELTSIDSKRRK